jgi:hypothetical protein
LPEILCRDRTLMQFAVALISPPCPVQHLAVDAAETLRDGDELVLGSRRHLLGRFLSARSVFVRTLPEGSVIPIGTVFPRAKLTFAVRPRLAPEQRGNSPEHSLPAKSVEFAVVEVEVGVTGEKRIVGQLRRASPIPLAVTGEFQRQVRDSSCLRHICGRARLDP